MTSTWRPFVHPAIHQQVAATQPPIWLWLVLVVIPTFALTWISAALMHWPEFANYTRQHHDTYFHSFFALQMTLILGAAAFALTKYRTALATPSTSKFRRILVALVIALPLIGYHYKDWNNATKFFDGISSLVENGDRKVAKEILHTAHHNIWGRLAYGDSPLGVLYSSLTSLLGPILEEVVYTGFLVNRLARPWGVLAAALITPLIFTMAHIPSFGFGFHLIELYFAGLTYALARLYTGKIGVAIAFHVMVNIVIFAPKWLIGTFYFMHG